MSSFIAVDKALKFAEETVRHAEKLVPDNHPAKETIDKIIGLLADAQEELRS